MGCERQSSIAEREHFQYLRRDELMQQAVRLAAWDSEPGRDERLRVGASHQGDASLRQAWLAVV
jgi:hypothetical protein